MRLPVSGVALTSGEPTGVDELFVVECTVPAIEAMVEICGRLLGPSVDWRAVPAVDLDAAALGLREALIGPVLSTDALCPVAGCDERIDVSFPLPAYLAHHAPSAADGVGAADADGWMELTGTAARVRIPTVGDLLAGDADELMRRCIAPVELDADLTRRADAVLQALAPRLDGEIGGVCPACGGEAAWRFDPLEYVLDELRDAFAGLDVETHALARAYGWTEATIHALPRGRRRRYASILADERRAA